MYMSIKEAKAIGKENMKFQWGGSLLILCIYAVLIACGNAIPVIGAVVVAGPLYYGLTYIYYHASLKEKINYWDIFKGFEQEFGDNFLSYVLVNVYTILWSLLFIVPGIIKAYSYSMFMYLQMREPELSATEAIDKSKDYMMGNKWRFFCLKLSFIGWDILEVLTWGLLAVYVEPWKYHAKMVFFNDVYEKKVLAEPEAEQANDVNDIDPQFVVKPFEIEEPNFDEFNK